LIKFHEREESMSPLRILAPVLLMIGLTWSATPVEAAAHKVKPAAPAATAKAPVAPKHEAGGGRHHRHGHKHAAPPRHRRPHRGHGHRRGAR
jgi:hypothetical protein